LLGFVIDLVDGGLELAVVFLVMIAGVDVLVSDGPDL